MDIVIKKINECTFDEALQAWNQGFEGYFFNATMTVDMFIGRFGREGLSSALSVVAFIDGKPVGLVVNGVRIINGKKVAWNGGTGVAPQHRHQGVGRALIQASLEVYRDSDVEVATLEAISENEKAIALYVQMGYKIIDDLVFYSREGAFDQNPFLGDQATSYLFKHGIPQDVQSLPFYRVMSPWQTQWANVRDGESIIAYDADGHEVGYAIFKRTFDETGKQQGIVLLQCESHPAREDANEIVSHLLSHVFGPFDRAVRRSTMNFPVTNDRVLDVLKEAGFSLTNQQVFMIRDMEKGE